MMPAIDYQGLVKNLKARFGRADLHDPSTRQACDRMCRQLTPLLELDRDIALEDVIDRLEEKWRSEGLIAETED